MSHGQLVAVLTALLYEQGCRLAEDTAETGLDVAVRLAREIIDRVSPILEEW